jgi:hypothetical protein
MAIRAQYPSVPRYERPLLHILLDDDAMGAAFENLPPGSGKWSLVVLVPAGGIEAWD